MPFSTSTTNSTKPNYSYKKNYKDLKPGYKDSTKTAVAKLQKELDIMRKKIPKPEYKFFDTVNTGAEVDSTGLVQTLHEIEQGPGQSQRIGDTIHVKTVLFRFSMYSGSK